MSRDFFSVSSILQAVKSAAAAASCTKVSSCVASGKICLTYNKDEFVLSMYKAKLLVVDHSGVERSDRSI